MAARPLRRAAQLLVLWGNSGGCAELATADDWPQTDAAASSSDGSTSGTAGAGGTAGSGGTGSCDATALDRFHDDFDDHNVNEQLWSTYAEHGATLKQADGVLTVGLPVRANARAGFLTVDWYDLRGCAVQLAVPSVPDGASAADTYLVLDGGDMSVMIRQQGDALYFQHWAKSEPTALASYEIGYLPEEHGLWRLVVVDGQVRGEVSMTGNDWASIGRSIEAPTFLNEAHVEIGAATSDGSAVRPGMATFDDVRATEP